MKVDKGYLIKRNENVIAIASSNGDFLNVYSEHAQMLKYDLFPQAEMLQSNNVVYWKEYPTFKVKTLKQISSDKTVSYLRKNTKISHDFSIVLYQMKYKAYFKNVFCTYDDTLELYHFNELVKRRYYLSEYNHKQLLICIPALI